MKYTTWLIGGLVLFTFVLAGFLYPRMPLEMASHWNIQGEVDGYLPRFWGVFLSPLVLAVIFLLFLVIPKIDPLKENLQKFRRYFDLFILFLVGFLLYLYLLTILWNLGWRFQLTKTLVPAFGLLYYFCGLLLEKAEPNWFVGIRTPWTLSDQAVWQKTHQLGARLFKMIALLALGGFFWPRLAFYFLLVPLFLVVLFLLVYSYLAYSKRSQG